MDPLNILLIDVEDRLSQRIASIPSHIDLNCLFAKREDNLNQIVNSANPAIIVYFTSLFSSRDSLEPVNMIRSNNITVPIIFITQHSTESRAIAAIRAGVNDYFKVPFSEKALLKSVRRNLKSISAYPGIKNIDALSPGLTGHNLVGETSSMREIKAY